MAIITLSSMMKKAASCSSISLANRSFRRNYTSAMCTSNSTSNIFGKVFRTISIPTRHKYCALAEKKSYSDDILLRVLESQIYSAEEKFHEFSEAHKDFPFKIEDNVMEDSIILTREYQGEEIKIKVSGPHRCYYDEEEEEEEEEEEKEEEEEEDQDDRESNKDDEKEEESDPHFVSLNISVSKKNGLTLKFNVSADSDEFTINGSLDITNPNASNDYPTCEEPEFMHLDEKLQKAFYKYMEVRGFEPSIGKFLCDYMVQRKHTKHTTWLKCLTNFITATSTSSISGEVIPTSSSAPLAMKNTPNSDDTLLSIIESVIPCAEKKYHEFADAPREFPFKIEDNPGEPRSLTRKSIKLTREYQGEEIQIKVDLPFYYPEHSDRYYDYRLIGSVSNQSGLNLKFDFTADSRGGIKIKSLDFKNQDASDNDKPYEWTPFWRLDEKLQDAFHAYLEVRGIEPSITKVLYDCTVKRYHKKYAAWLKHFKNFIAS